MSCRCRWSFVMTSSMPQVPVMDDEDTLSIDEEESLPLTNTSEVQPSGSATAMLNYLAGGGFGVAPVLPLPMPRPAVFSKKSSIRDNKGSAFKKSVNPRVSREEELGVRMKNTKSRVGMRKKKSAKLDADEQLSEDVAKLAASNQGIVEKIYKHRKNKGVLEYRVKWVGYDGPQDDAWEPLRHITSEHSQAMLRDYRTSSSAK
ncbi:uncharacterized protein LOC135498946 isoform X1 [Lineus longissimus]|uniref:uncharacterized protein LOC135498946 isoform X1 n=2 Tax=Lineus longissimus TaxID=88925 RepID=UPI00315D1A70